MSQARMMKDLHVGDYFMKRIHRANQADRYRRMTVVQLKTNYVRMDYGDMTMLWSQADLNAIPSLGWTFHWGFPAHVRLPQGA